MDMDLLKLNMACSMCRLLSIFLVKADIAGF